MSNTSAQKAKNKSEARAAIKATKEGRVISPAQNDDTEKINQTAKVLGMGSVLDDLRSMDSRPGRRR